MRSRTGRCGVGALGQDALDGISSRVRHVVGLGVCGRGRYVVIERQEQAKGNLIAALGWPLRHRPVNRGGYEWPAGTPRLEVSNMDARKRPERQQAVQEAKQAVRAYAREPSRANADAVELAWRKVRQFDSLAEWRWGGVTVSPSMRGASPTP